MNFRRWVVFSFVVHLAVILVDKGAGFVLLALTHDRRDEKGGADLLTTLPFILTAVANLGLATSLVYFVRKRRYDLLAAAETTSLVALVWGTLVSAAALACCAFLLPALNPEWQMSAWLYAPVCLCVPFQLLASYGNSVQLAAERVREYNLVHLCASVLFLPTFLACYWLADGQAEYGISYARLISAALIAGITVVLVRRFLAFRPRLHADFLREGLAYGWQANVTSVLTYLSHRLDLFLLRALFVGVPALQGAALARSAKDQVALYGLALTFAELVWHFPEATRDLFFSKVAGVSIAEARRLTPILARLCVVVAVIGSAVVYWTVDPVLALLIPTWTDGWAPTVMPALQILIPGTVMFTLAKILQNDLAGRGHLGVCIAACVLNLVVMIVLGCLWMPEGGALGAAKASTLGFMVTSVFTLVAYQRRGGARWWECVFVRRSDWQYAREILVAIKRKLR